MIFKKLGAKKTVLWKKRINDHSRQLIAHAMLQIDQVRRHKGIKQQVLCSQIGISTKTYAALLRGDCNRLDVFLKIADMVYFSSEIMLR